MKLNSDFWATLDRLAKDLSQEGTADANRAANLATVLETFPKAKRADCLANLAKVAESLPVIFTYCQLRDGESG